MIRTFPSILCILAFASVCQCANILYISTLPSRSHHIWDKTLAMGLLERNHNLTFFTHSPEMKATNFTPIVIEGVYEEIAITLNFVSWYTVSTLNSIIGIYDWFGWICSKDLESKAIHSLLAEAKNGVKYDLIITDMTTGQCLYPLIQLFGSPPVIGTSPYGLNQYFSFAFGIDINIAYNPLNLLPYTDHMSLWERMLNYFYTIFSNYWRQWVYLPGQQKLAEEFFGKDITPLGEMEKTFSLLLTNTDPIFDYPQPVPPAIIQVGGLHIFKKTNTLPNDLQQFIDNSKYGVIYFSFGTNIRTNHLDEKIISTFLEAFTQLEENILWKFDSKLENISSNILIKQWLPQNDILAHPKVKLFISHGGALSTQEAMYHGVPVLGVPFFADQHVNMRKMTVRKLGLTLDYNNITTVNLLSRINELIQNTIYKQNIQTVSVRYRDKPQNALERAIFWTEYVIRHGEAKHMHTAAKNMPFYRTWLLDIWAITGLAVLLIIYTVRLVCRRPNKQKRKIKKN